MPPANVALEGVDDLGEHGVVDPLHGRAGQELRARGRAAVEGAEVLVLVDADAPHALGGGRDHAAGAGLAAGAEDHVGTLTDELLGVGRALVRRR